MFTVKNRGKPNELSKKICITIATFILSIGAVSAQEQAKNRLTDSEITDAVESEFLLNESVSSYAIEANTNQGIVILEGTANHLLEKKKAEEIVKAVRGVRGVVNLIEIRQFPLHDSTLVENVEFALLNNPVTEVYEVNVRANRGNITLEGMVDSWQEKQITANVARAVEGVRSVDNQVAYTINSDRSDYEIQKDIEGMLRNDVRLEDGLVDVSVNDGKVNLSGIIGSLAEKDVAYSNAWVAGTNAVDSSDLRIEPLYSANEMRGNKYAYRTDNEITRAVLDALFYDPRVTSSKVSVSTDNGVVTLRGTLESFAAKKAAKSTTNNIVGVLNIKNYVKVFPSYVPSNVVLEARLTTAFDSNPMLQDEDIDFNAKQGIVTLRGTVDSEVERIYANDIAANVKGVIFVEDDLGVRSSSRKDAINIDYLAWNQISPTGSIYSDAELEAEVEYQLWWSPFVDTDQVEVTANNGLVTLSGTVDSKREKRYATINAYEGGADEVDNNLEVQYALPDGN